MQTLNLLSLFSRPDPSAQIKQIRVRTDLARLIKPHAIAAELGVAEGSFSSALLDGSKLAHLYSIDMYEGDRGHDVAEYKRTILKLNRHRSRNSLIRMRFDQAVSLFPDEFFDFVYIDGYAHTGQENGKTLAEWYAKAKPGAVFAGDDYSPTFPLVVEAVNTFVKLHELQLHVLTFGPSDDQYSKHPSWVVFKPTTKRPVKMDHRDGIIASIAPGKSFAEVGGLWGLVNEKLTVAHSAGATKLCMIDIWKPDSEWWVKFHDRCADLGIKGVREVVGSIDNQQTLPQIGRYDVVHCAGVLYHCPNPVLTLSHLSAITKETLILTTAVMPEVISNEMGNLMLSDDKAIFVPGISEQHRRIADKYIAEKYGAGAWGINHPVDAWYFSDGTPNYGPWWWLWTPGYVRRMITAIGLTIIDERSQFEGTGHLFVCKRNQLEAQNFGNY